MAGQTDGQLDLQGIKKEKSCKQVECFCWVDVRWKGELRSLLLVSHFLVLPTCEHPRLSGNIHDLFI